MVVAGVGFFTDTYDLFAINLASAMLGVAFWQKAGGKIPSSSDTAIKISTASGNVIGQLLFGWLVDRVGRKVGRKRIYGLELIIMIFATLAQSLSSDPSSMSIVGVLVFWRLVMGIVKPQGSGTIIV